MDWKTYSEWANENVMVWGLIETTEGLENLEDILDQGLDAVSFGGFDLSMAMGFGGDTKQPDLKKEVNRAAEIALKKGIDIFTVILTTELEVIRESARFWKEKGCRLITTTTDRAILCNSHQEMLHLLKDLEK